jgi:colanic acid/amylovoran biosynthesis glycosyltransferase
MTTIAYLANQYPNSIETYVSDEIAAVRKEGAAVFPCSIFGPQQAAVSQLKPLEAETLYLSHIDVALLLRALIICIAQFDELWDFWKSAFSDSSEPTIRKLKAILHTFLGVYFAALLEEKHVDHIHVHHGYVAAWVAMVAARLLNIGYSITLHGSDLLVDHPYLDIKLRNCDSCFTVSEYNRAFIVRTYPSIDRSKVLLRRLGVALPLHEHPAPAFSNGQNLFVIMSVGRLQAVKNHKFLIDGSAILKSRGVPVLCLIAGEGPERRELELRIATCGVDREVKLLGHVTREDLDTVYSMVDVVALTSTSEGIPVSLMEAMAHARIVIAPAITGVPELVLHGETGFLYQPDSLQDFVSRIEAIASTPRPDLDAVRQAAREHVRRLFDREQNLQNFVDVLLDRISPRNRVCHENPVLQQI